MDRNHQFIQFSDALPCMPEVNKIVKYILNKYLNQYLSIKQYKKQGKIRFPWRDNKGNTQESAFRFTELTSHVQTDRTFDWSKFNLPPLLSEWLDANIGITKPDAPIPNVSQTNYLIFELNLPFGNKFPLKPSIDREGVAFSTFQLPIQRNIVRLYKKLVSESQLATDLNGIWLNDFRMLINDCVSIVDITLHQLYFMAQYRGGEKGWTFTPDKLGSRYGQRLTEKLAWIHHITGQSLDHARDEVANFVVIKDLRNHLSHFDPPCLAYTMEDLVGWLNRVQGIGKLLWKIREKLDTLLSSTIVEILTLPRVVFVPIQPDDPRVPQSASVGYRSSTWQ